MTIIEHEGKVYVALDVHSTAYDGSDGFDVFVVEVTPAVLAYWDEKIALADQLERDHKVLCVTFNAFEGPSAGDWRRADFEVAIEDSDIAPPIWSDEPQRTELDTLEFSAHHLEWVAMPKHTDDHVNAILWRSDLPAIREYLSKRKDAVQA